MVQESAGTEQRRKRAARGKAIAAAALGLLPAALFFLPYLEFTFQQVHYRLSGLQTLTAAGIQVNGPNGSALVGIPPLLRGAVACGVLLGLLGGLLLLLRRPVGAGICYGLCAAAPVAAVLSSGGIRKAVAGLGITQIQIRYPWPLLLVAACGLLAALLALWTRGGEKLAESVFLAFACVSVGSVLFIMLYIFSAGAPAIWSAGVGNFLFGTQWSLSAGKFGILPLILSSIAGTLGAIVLGVPIGLFTAVFLAEVAPRRLAALVRPAVELLAGIPSVIYGFFGMMVIVPAIRNFPPFSNHTVGHSLLAVILVLAVMVLPTIVSTAETALRAVPISYREASLALGSTPVQTIFKVTVPAARSGILSGVILGVGRAIGETMAVVMVAGNIPNMPHLLGAVKLMTTGIAIDMNYATEAQRPILFGIGLVLFLFIMVVNISFTAISRRGAQMESE